MADYTDLDLDRDQASIADSQVEYHQGQIPGWDANAGDPATLLIESTSEQHSETRELAVDVARGIYADIGETVFNIPRLTPTQASGTTTWTTIDTAGLEIPAGTLIEVTGRAFVTTTAVSIPVSSSTTAAGEVPILALETGSDGNGLTGDASLVDTLATVDTITIVDETAGGSDGETRDEYVDRLVEELRIYAPRPIRPTDFEVLARRVEGVERALAINLLKPGTNEKQRVTITGSPVGGTFTLTYSGQTTAGIAYNAAATDVETALEALSNIGADDVHVTGGPLPGSFVDVEFQRALGETDVAAMTKNAAGLTGGTSPDVTISTPTAGVAALTSEERNVTVVIQDADGEAVPSTIRDDVDDLLQDEREINFVVNVIDPTYTTFDVTVTVKAYPDWDSAAVQGQVESAVESFLDPALWGQPPTGEQRKWVNNTKVREYDLAAAIENADGVSYIETLSFGPAGGSMGTADVTMPGHAPLPRAGTITVTVNAA